MVILLLFILMKKILLVITKDDVGGAQKYVRDLTENLDPKKFKVKILIGGKKRSMIDDQGSTVKYLSNSLRPHFLFLNDLAAVIEMFLIFRRERPDIIHLNSSKAGVIGAFAAWLYKTFGKLFNSSTFQLKTVFTAHGWVFNPDNNLSRLRRWFYIWLHRLAGKFQDAIINVSEYDRKLAIKEGIASPEKLFTVRNGIDYENMKFFEKIIAREKLVKLINQPHNSKFLILDSSQKWVGSIGRLVSEKNYEDFIKATALVKNPTTKFFIIGDGYQKKSLELRIKNLGLKDRFFILGGIAPAAPYLKAFDVFVLSSVKEGLPYTMVEAMAAELPLVVTRVGGMTEIIEGRGLVMPPREPTELARAIEHYLINLDEARQAAQKSHQFLEENLSLVKMIKETEVVYSLN